MTHSKSIDEKRKELKNLLKKETALIAYLDLANVFHWQDALGWKFSIKDLISQLLKLPSVKEVKVYFGTDPRNPVASASLHKRILKAGAILRSKPVKYIRKTINEAFFFKKSTLTLFDDAMTVRISDFVSEMAGSGAVIEEPKCNFDVEMAMDMMDDSDRITGIMLFSGDSDFKAPLERLRVKGKKVYVVGVRGQVAKELFEVSDRFINFGVLYEGVKRYIAKIPPEAGSREL